MSKGIRGALVCLGALALGWIAAPGVAVTPEETGYWWRLNGVTPVALSPLTVPDGGLDVASDHTGPLAVSALRLRSIPPGQEAQRLVLTALSTTGGAPAIRVCRSSGWQPTDGAGRWDERATDVQCDTGRDGVVDTDGSTWTFDLEAMVVNGVLDVVLVPGPGSFEVVFAPPGPDSVVVAAPHQPDEAPDPGAEPPPFGPAPAGGPSSDLGSAFGDFSRSGLTSLPDAAPAAAPTQEVVVLPPLVATPVVDVGPLSGPVGAGSRSPLALLAVAIVAAAWVHRTRAAVAAVAHHPLSRPVAAEHGAALADAGAALGAGAAEAGR